MSKLIIAVSLIFLSTTSFAGPGQGGVLVKYHSNSVVEKQKIIVVQEMAFRI